MQFIISIACFTTIGCYSLLFLWYFFWPEAEAVVEHVGFGAPVLPNTPYKRQHRLISYSFEYQGKRVTSRRQGLLTANGFGPKLLVQQKFNVKVCPLYLPMSCPKRYLFETLVYLIVCCVAVPTGLVYYFEKYGNWG